MSLTQFVTDASKVSVHAGLLKVKSDYLPTKRFLDNANRLAIDGVSCVEEHFNPGLPGNFTRDDANTYLGSSALLHCFDGWQFLSHAVDSLLKGDTKAAIHLCYYAELRAAMSFLAAEGIGIFSTVHFCQEANGNSQKDPLSTVNNSNRWRGKGTHKFVWSCLDEWINLPIKTSTDILDGFSHNGKTFTEWIGKIPGANSVNVISVIIKDWLRSWSFDIQNLEADRDGRNNASYRPSLSSTYINQNLAGVVSDYQNLLQLIEPGPSGQFALLDKHIFKLLFLRIHAEIVAQTGPISYDDLLDNTFKAASVPKDEALRLLINTPHNHNIFTYANNTLVDVTGSSNPLNIFSRALLMLRVACSTISASYKRAGIKQSEFSFYIDYFGIENGFWKPGIAIGDYQELWTDISDSILDIDHWLQNHPAPHSLKGLYEAKAQSLTYFKQINRASLWGTAI